MTKKNPPAATEGNQKIPDLNLMRNDYTKAGPALIAARVESHDWQMSSALLMCVAFEWDLKSDIEKHFSGVSPQRQAIFKDLILRYAQVKKEVFALKEEIDSELKSQLKEVG